jgi:hypothetical protein
MKDRLNQNTQITRLDKLNRYIHKHKNTENGKNSII